MTIVRWYRVIHEWNLPTGPPSLLTSMVVGLGNSQMKKAIIFAVRIQLRRPSNEYMKKTEYAR
ncbi:MAG TPA: hypothetical protein VH500_18375 [Nitrososphaeraceae archaeon]